MKQFIVKNKNAIAAIAAIVLLGGILMSFQDSPAVHLSMKSQDLSEDTLPEKDYRGSMKMKDFDNLMNQLDNTMLQAGDLLKNINLEQIRKQVQNSLKQVDMEKIQRDIELSLKQINLDKIMEEVTSSLKSIDWANNKALINQALSEAKQEIEKSRAEIAHIDMKEIKKDLENARLEIEKSKWEINKIDMNKIMDEAKDGIEKAKEELRQTRTMFSEMEKDGLVSAKDGFTIEYKDKELYINGRKQPENVTDKYRKYFSKDHFKITIDKE